MTTSITRRSSVSSVESRESTFSKKAPGRVLYRVEWSDDLSNRRQNFESETPFEHLETITQRDNPKATDKGDPSDKPAFVVITPVSGTTRHGAFQEEEKGSVAEEEVETTQQPDRKAVDMKVPFDDIMISSVGRTKLVIYSQPLLKTLRGVIMYYPGQSLTGEKVAIYEPYEMLVHYIQELDTLQAKLRQSNETDDTLHHLSLLLDYVHTYMRPEIDDALSRIHRSDPMVSYEHLWLLFKPGIDIYLKDESEALSLMDQVFAAVLIRCQLGMRDKSDGEVDLVGTRGIKRSDCLENRNGCWLFTVWSLSTDGERFGRDRWTRTIDWFEGERTVTSLLNFPSHYRDILDGGKTRRAFEQRGRQAYDLLRAQPRQMWYDGYEFTVRKRLYRGGAIIDVATAMLHNNFLADPDQWSFLQREITPSSVFTDMAGQPSKEFIWAKYMSFNIKESESLPSEHHYFLVEPVLPGFALMDKEWKIFYVESLKEINQESNMDSLIIDETNRNIVESVCHTQDSPWRMDTVANKGEGQVALLHGPPGVGKTYTVECIAQSTGRPLIAMTMGDLMRDEDQIETRLLKWFTLAEKWKAILLLDEADIFLERRAARDIQRNGVVSTFLRNMEYFRGLLFLTTNRVGQIDDAFLSRVSVVLEYDHLSDDTRKKIWNGFFKRLHKESQSDSHKGRRIEIDRYAQKYVLNDEEVKDLKWNGREIRNALQTAISLATYKAFKEGEGPDKTIEVEEEHFRSVVTMSRKFKSYMKSISGKEEEDRAKARMERNTPHPD